MLPAGEASWRRTLGVGAASGVEPDPAQSISWMVGTSGFEPLTSTVSKDH
jgi:hypothetical protein